MSQAPSIHSQEQNVYHKSKEKLRAFVKRPLGKIALGATGVAVLAAVGGGILEARSNSEAAAQAADQKALSQEISSTMVNIDKTMLKQAARDPRFSIDLSGNVAKVTERIQEGDGSTYNTTAFMGKAGSEANPLDPLYITSTADIKASDGETQTSYVFSSPQGEQYAKSDYAYSGNLSGWAAREQLGNQEAFNPDGSSSSNDDTTNPRLGFTPKGEADIVVADFNDQDILQI